MSQGVRPMICSGRHSRISSAFPLQLEKRWPRRIRMPSFACSNSNRYGSSTLDSTDGPESEDAAVVGGGLEFVGGMGIARPFHSPMRSRSRGSLPVAPGGPRYQGEDRFDRAPVLAAVARPATRHLSATVRNANHREQVRGYLIAPDPAVFWMSYHAHSTWRASGFAWPTLKRIV